MTRKIKFRAWDEEDKKMKYPNLIGWYSNDHTCWGDGDAFEAKELMQFTGLKDKQGKEIYEGDIVGLEYDHGWLVIFDDGAFRLKDDKHVTQGNRLLVQESAKRLKIIGNIYEMPELTWRN